MALRPKTVAEYIAALRPDQRRVLRALRAQVRAAAPGATETLSYGIPTYKVDGKAVAYFGAWEDHFSLYGFPTTGVPKRFVTGKGTIAFTADDPLPAALVTKLIKRSVSAKAKRSKY